MKQMSVFFKLIRWKNLMVVALIPILFRFCIVEPVLAMQGMESALRAFEFFVLVLSVVSMTAAGYVINDYFDLRIDQVNKASDGVIIGNKISRRSAIIIHWVLNFISIFAGFYVAVQTRYWLIIPAILTVLVVLSLYSVWFKRAIVAGNLLVSLLAALLVPFFWLIEMRCAGLDHTGGLSFEKLAVYVLFYPIFAFLTTLIREIVKDMEDIEGDRTGGRKTLAVVHGNKFAAITATIVSTLTLGVLIIYAIYFVVHEQWLFGAYLFLGVMLPLGYIGIYIPKAKAVHDFWKVQSILKITMVAGVLTMVFHFYTPGV